MELIVDVGLTLAVVVAYLGAGIAAAVWLRHRCLRRFGRAAAGLDGFERSSLAWLGGLIALIWPAALIMLAAAAAADWVDQGVALVFARRWYSHLSADLDAGPGRCTLARGRHRDDTAALEQTYARTAPPAGPVTTATGAAGWAEIHTARCPGCGIVLYRIALVTRPAGTGQDPAAVAPAPGADGTLLAATGWLPQEHDAVWAARGTPAGSRALTEYLTAA